MFDDLLAEPIVGPPHEGVATVYDTVRRACELTSDGPFLGELKDGKYEWRSYGTVRDSRFNKLFGGFPWFDPL